MAWYNLLTYKPSAAGALGAVGGGWTDSGSKWQVATVPGGTDLALTTAYNSSQPWANAALVRRATAEQTNNGRVSFRWMSTGTGGIANAAELLARFDTSGNALIARMGQVWALASNGTTGSSTNGTYASYAASTWYDTQISWVTSGSTTTITEKTWSVTDRVNSAFASGTLLSPTAGNSYTSTLYPNVSAALGVYFYLSGTTGSGYVNFFATDTDVPATGISLSPSSTTGTAGSSITFTLTAAGAQNGGAVTLSDGGAGGTFSPASPTMPAGVNQSVSFTYTPAVAGSVTVTASSSALIGSALSATASITASAPAAADHLGLSPLSQTVAAGSASGPYTVSANGYLSSAVVVTLNDGGAGGSFTPATVTLAAGVGSTATVTYTPAGSASGTINITATGPGLYASTVNAVVTASTNATALAVSPSSQSVTAGSATGAYTVSVNGTLASATTVNLSDGGAGGTFNPASVSLASGSGSTGTFTYTPASGAATGTATLTVSASGLTSATASASVTAAALGAFVKPGSAGVVQSPLNWVTGLSNSTAGDSSAIRTWYTGAYLRIVTTGCSSVGIVFGAGTTSATFAYQLDDGAPSQPIACLNGGTYTVTLPNSGTHLLTFMLHSITQAAGRWAGTLAVTINGFQLGAGGSVINKSAAAKTLLIYGDSITEGTQSRDGVDGITSGYAYAVAQSVMRQGGWEYCIKGAGYSGFVFPVPSANGGQPAAFTAGNDASSSYNKIDGSGAAGAAITTGTPGSAAERFIVQPTLILINWGTNDGLQGISLTTLQAAILGLLQQLRVCAPNAIIVVTVPFGGYVRATIQAAVAAAVDPKVILVDPQTDSKMTAAFYCGNPIAGTVGTQNVHPWSYGSQQLGALLVSLMQAAFVPFGVARSYGALT